MSFEIDLTGKIALVTGASQGIGAQMARTFHAAGAKVLLNHPDLGETRADAEQVASACNALRPGSAGVIAADVAQAGAVQAMMRQVQEVHGGLDILINNAAIIRDRTIARMTLEEWNSVLGVDLHGVFHCCKYGLEIMREGGAIVNMGSIAAIQGFFGQANYAAAKGGVLALTRVLSREGAKRNIRANAIAPGVIDTAMARTIPEPVRSEMMKNIPLNRFGEPREVAEVALFLCSPWASYVTGQTIEVNGGWRG